MKGQDQMPESLKRTEEIERGKSSHQPRREHIQAPERPDKTEEIEKGKKEKPGSL